MISVVQLTSAHDCSDLSCPGAETAILPPEQVFDLVCRLTCLNCRLWYCDTNGCLCRKVTCVMNFGRDLSSSLPRLEWLVMSDYKNSAL